MTDDLLGTVKKNLELHAKSGFYMSDFSAKDTLRALVDRCEQAEAEVERAARFCYLEGWNDVAHERGADFNRAWAAWLASSAKAALEGDHD
jgi:hypothetical protein